MDETLNLRYKIILAVALVIFAILACQRSAPETALSPGGSSLEKVIFSTSTRTPFMPPTRSPDEPLLTPTPDQPRILPTPRKESDQHVVQYGESLGNIAQRYSVNVNSLIAANQLINPDLLYVGQTLVIPAPQLQTPGSKFKIIPDSELVYGPYSAYVDYAGIIRSKNGFLAHYEDELDDQQYTGIEIVQRVSQDYSVNPLLLLAVLEHQSDWITNSEPISITRTYPIGLYNSARKGLYSQLVWTANQLNMGYYLWRVNGVGTWVLPDGSAVPIDPTINAGTAAVQNLFAQLYTRAEWDRAVSPNGLFATYSALFGYPFDYSIDPLVPPNLEQPPLQLPFENGKVWSYTGGPHSGWDSGSAWAALDFAPPGEARGCVLSGDWVVAVADGLVVRADQGSVVQELDGDGLEQTGWAILYLHIDRFERVQAGTYLKAGDRIGHPSCEGGYSVGTHLHIARKYNGEWISSDRDTPFVMDGWVSSSSGVIYNGYLTKDGQRLMAEAYNQRSEINKIQR